VIPVLDEERVLGATLAGIRPELRPGDEIIVVDGGSRDGTRGLALAAGVTLHDATRGRAAQQNAGARVARGDVLVFLHADTRPGPGAGDAIRNALGSPDVAWGHFRLRLDGGGVRLRVIERGIALRDALGWAPTGDQAIFVRRDLFLEVGGFPDVPIMEDLLLTRALARRSRPVRLTPHVTTSARRWRARGVARTVLLMLALRAASRLGVSHERLAALYRDVR
jgi:rSAM/selenodomain-associated transferase 2